MNDAHTHDKDSAHYSSVKFSPYLCSYLVAPLQLDGQIASLFVHVLNARSLFDVKPAVCCSLRLAPL